MGASKVRPWRLVTIWLCLMWPAAAVQAVGGIRPPVRPVLAVESPYPLDQTVANLRLAIDAANFRLVRELPWHGGLMQVDRRGTRAKVLYFCNFSMVNDAIAVDRRFSQFLPCRMTVSERHGKVIIKAVDPLYISQLLGNARLGPACYRARNMYLRLMDEATL